MSRQKSIIVTIIVAFLFAFTVYSAWRLDVTAYPVMIGALAAYGFASGAAAFARWLGKETPLLPARTQQNEDWEPDEDFCSTYDQIRTEVQEGRL